MNTKRLARKIVQKMNKGRTGAEILIAYPDCVKLTIRDFTDLAQPDPYNLAKLFITALEFRRGGTRQFINQLRNWTPEKGRFVELHSYFDEFIRDYCREWKFENGTQHTRQDAEKSEKCAVLFGQAAISGSDVHWERK